jgi:hypothetical protein
MDITSARLRKCFGLFPQTTLIGIAPQKQHANGAFYVSVCQADRLQNFLFLCIAFSF